MRMMVHLAANHGWINTNVVYHNPDLPLLTPPLLLKFGRLHWALRAHDADHSMISGGVCHQVGSAIAGDDRCVPFWGVRNTWHSLCNKINVNDPYALKSMLELSLLTLLGLSEYMTCIMQWTQRLYNACLLFTTLGGFPVTPRLDPPVLLQFGFGSNLWIAFASVFKIIELNQATKSNRRNHHEFAQLGRGIYYDFLNKVARRLGL